MAGRIWPLSNPPVTKNPLPLCVVLAAALVAGGGENGSKSSASASSPAADPGTAAPAAGEESAPPPDEAIAAALSPSTGDIDEMRAKRRIRMLVTFSRTNYFLDKGRQMGATAEAGLAFEKFVNKELQTKNVGIHVLFVPVRRDKILTALRDGRGDIAAANLTVTADRARLADFSAPFTSNVSEVVVTTRGTPGPASIEELSGRDVYVRNTSSYYETLLRLNASFKAQGKPPVRIVEADDQLEDEDILEMVNAGLVTTTVVDDHLAHLWNQVYDQLDVHDTVALRRD